MWASLPTQADETLTNVTVKARPIDNFLIGRDQTQFGPLEFVGGLELTANARHFGALSGLHVDEDQNSFIAVSDTGYWVEGKFSRDTDGRIVTLENVSLREIMNDEGKPQIEKWLADAEGVTKRGSDIFVSFEREHRIERHTRDAQGMLILKSKSLPPVPLYELRQNRGFEGIAFAPADSALQGALVGVSEKSLDRAGNIMAFVAHADGTSFEFSVERNNGFDVTDIAFLPDGDLILLERSFTVSQGVAMRLRRVTGSDIGAKATVDGPVLLEADMRSQIDNMEGLSVTIDADGTPRLTLLSDDNHSLLQRNLVLEFRLVGAPDQAATSR